RPGNRLHVQGVQRKKRGDQRTRPSGACCSQQKPEDKQRVCHMNQCVNEQMAACKYAEELAIDHMCDPREWMPVSLVKSGKRPGESPERNTAIHYWVPLDIRKVIGNDEAMPDHLRINPKRYYRQTQQDEKIGSLECCRTGDGIFLPGCVDPPVFCLLRRPFSHAVCEIIREPWTHKTLKL